MGVLPERTRIDPRGRDSPEQRGDLKPGRDLESGTGHRTAREAFFPALSPSLRRWHHKLRRQFPVNLRRQRKIAVGKGAFTMRYEA